MSGNTALHVRVNLLTTRVSVAETDSARNGDMVMHVMVSSSISSMSAETKHYNPETIAVFTRPESTVPKRLVEKSLNIGSK